MKLAKTVLGHADNMKNLGEARKLGPEIGEELP